MALITQASLTGIADRVARQYGKVATAFTTINATSVTNKSYFTWASEDDDPDVEIPLVASYYNTDINTTLATCVRSGMGTVLTIVTQMDTHFTRTGVSLTGSWNGYCTLKDMRVSDYFNQVYYLAKSAYMYANNVFSEGNDLFGTVDLIAGPTVVFTDGTNYGNGAATNLATGGQYAATQLRARIVTKGATLLDLTITGKNKLNVSFSVDVAITANSAPGADVNVGTSADRFLDVTSVIFKVAGSTGDVNDQILLYNKQERDIDITT